MFDFDTIRPRIRGIYYAFANNPVPLHRNEQSQPFFVVGSGRCGTTLLRRILQASPEVHIPPENWGLGYAIHHFKQNRWYLGWRQLADIVVSTHEHRSHNWFDTPPTELVEDVVDWPESKRSLYALVDRIYRHHGKTTEAQFARWGDKTPLNINHMASILRVFPDARFVHLLRDGVDVVHSYSKRSDYLNEVVRPARRWCDAVERARSFAERHGDRLLEVRYERLCRKPEAVTERICQFLNLSGDADLVSRTDHYDELGNAQTVDHFQNVFNPITTDSIGKGRRELAPEQKEKISSHLDEHLIRLGYEPAEG